MKKLILFFILFPIFLFAKEYSLSEIINIGLNKNDDLRISKLSLENSNSSFKTSIYDFLPSINVSGSQSESTTGSSTSANFSLSKSFSLNEPTYFNYKKSKIAKISSEYQYESSKQNVIYNIVLKYISVEENKNNLRIQKSNFQIQKDGLEKSRVLFQNKMISEMDLTDAEISKINAKISLKDAENSLKNSLEDLKNYVKIDDAEFQISETDFSKYIDPKIPEFSYNNDIVRDSLNLVSLKISKTSQKLSFLPDLTFSYSTNISNSDFKEDGNILDFNTDFENSHSHSLSCNISYSLWNILKHGENYKIFKRNLRSNTIAFNKAKRDLKQNYREQKRDLENLTQTYRLYKKKLNLAQKNYTQAAVKYEAGMINQIDFEKAKNTLLRAKLDEKKIQYQLIKSQINIEKLLSLKILNKG